MASVFYRIHDANIHAFHQPGGEVYNLLNTSGIAAAELARQYVGKRSMKLHNTIQANRPNQTGGFTIATLVFANAKHAHWHHEGTLDRTPLPKKGTYMTVPKRAYKGSVSGGALRAGWIASGSVRGNKPYFLATFVRGQKGNPYLKDGMEAALARSPYLTFTGT